MTLFHLDPVPERAVPTEALSRDAKRTRRQRADIARGIHPVARIPLAGNDETCGSCAHAIKVNWSARSYWKCELVPFTHGSGTDIRLKWPACTRWEGVEPEPRPVEDVTVTGGIL